MPVAVSHPGVYIEELPSGVRTITGVATSITAFVGWAPKGPTDRAELILSWPDFERKFGGLNVQSFLGYAVYQFFANGGQRAYVVRLVVTKSDTATDIAKPATVGLDGKLTVTAKNGGEWGNAYAVVTKVVSRSGEEPRFQIKVLNVKDDPKGIPVEAFENLSMKETSSRNVVNVLNNQSSVVNAAIVGNPAEPPADTVIPASGEIPNGAKLSGGTDGKVLAPNDSQFEGALQPIDGAGGVFLLDRVDLFNLLCVPGETKATVLAGLQKFCRDRRAFLIADAPKDATVTTLGGTTGLDGLTGSDAINAALYFPWLIAPDPLRENGPQEYPPSGYVAGLFARTDSARGVWKAPAGTEASLSGVLGVKTMLTNGENGVLNPKAVNCIRNFPVYGTILWGARTLQGNDERGSEWKYVPVRRTALFIEETLYRALQWVVFEPNDEPLWAQIRLNVGAFLQSLFQQGAFQGRSPQEAYFVKCDKETTTQNDINLGIVNIVVGFAPLKPAEFVIVKLQQIAGQIQT
jgi:phage tail sheath protein FI